VFAVTTNRARVLPHVKKLDDAEGALMSRVIDDQP